MDVKELKYTKEHEWVGVEGDVAAIGISDYAQKELGDVVYVELPTVGDTVDQDDACSNIESVKAVSDIYSPFTGEIVEANELLEDAPETINKDPYGDGWIFKIKMADPGQLDDLMDFAAYEEYLKGIVEE
ncbi:MAG: glycine cleavage system protein GcvH [bacterium]|nr:glycine cleavage system protein GcvH [bacterium]